ncbi:branched-chain amino acid transport system II carrier protein [Virgibacillus halophilus]|uniref:branched-chain amino acid transport system II carrier protein n=1 Tax=Tigheibacillus halophilus TaxID=361280 RepID=UPI0036330055
MKTKLSFSSHFFIGVMLFALFFGAGNLIFPAELGQNAGDHLLPAAIGFLITGIGLPLLGILAMGFSGSKDLQELSGRVHPLYGIIFTILLYLTIGPFFAAPRTGAVAYEIGISPFVGEAHAQLGLLIFTFLFFAASLIFSLYPAKLVDNVGKILSPGIIILLLILLIMVFVKPLGAIEPAQQAYSHGPFLKGFTEGYNTMDALASLVFGIIVIQSVRALGVKSNKQVLSATAKAGIVASSFLGLIYIGIAYLGAVSTQEFGIFATGGPVLSEAAAYYFGTVGSVMLAVIITLACLTTSIGLMTACGEYFHKLMPKISYKVLVTFFTAITFIFANFGLADIIKYSVPVLMLLYPLAIVLVLLTFLSSLFRHARLVYASVTGVTFLISIVDGFKSLCESLEIDYFAWLKPILTFYTDNLPLYEEGLGWLLPALIVMVVTTVIVYATGKKSADRPVGQQQTR